MTTDLVRVLARPDPTDCRLDMEGLPAPVRCAIGRSGVSFDKHEGDGATPLGRFPLRRVFYRADRIAAPATGLPCVAIAEDLGWCDDPDVPQSYNRAVRLPFSGSHERMWRDDHVYDIVVELGWNDSPPVPGLGSAIFMHLSRPDWSPTEGCVALLEQDLRRVLSALGPTALMDVSRAL